MLPMVRPRGCPQVRVCSEIVSPAPMPSRTAWPGFCPQTQSWTAGPPSPQEQQDSGDPWASHILSHPSLSPSHLQLSPAPSLAQPAATPSPCLLGFLFLSASLSEAMWPFPPRPRPSMHAWPLSPMCQPAL